MPRQDFIGKIEKGFDFPGHHLSPNGPSTAEKTIEKFCARASRRFVVRGALEAVDVRLIDGSLFEVVN
jgi:hypothetical protein